MSEPCPHSSKRNDDQELRACALSPVLCGRGGWSQNWQRCDLVRQHTAKKIEMPSTRTLFDEDEVEIKLAKTA